MKTTSLARSSEPSPHADVAFFRHRVFQNHITRHWLVAAIIVALTGTTPAQVPQFINYQGCVAVGTTNFQGTGSFKFTPVDANESTTPIFRPPVLI
jgi:hypothetical protein